VARFRTGLRLDPGLFLLEPLILELIMQGFSISPPKFIQGEKSEQICFSKYKISIKSFKK